MTGMHDMKTWNHKSVKLESDKGPLKQGHFHFGDILALKELRFLNIKWSIKKHLFVEN